MTQNDNESQTNNKGNENRVPNSGPIIDDQQQIINDITEQQVNHQNRNLPQQQNKEVWYSVNKILKQRKVGNSKQYLIEWSNSKAKPSWQDENDISEELKRHFFIKHTRSGKRRKIPYRYFDKEKFYNDCMKWGQVVHL